jgi:uncharacterized protein DUF3617
MTLSRTALLLVAGAGLLAGCSQPASNSATNTAAATSAAAPASGPDTVITQADLPHPKAGLWMVTTSMNGGPAHTLQNCYKGEPLKMQDHAIPGCTGLVLKRTFLGDYVMDAACSSQQGMSSSMHMVVHGDFLGGSYTTNGTAHIAMPGRPPMDFTTHSEAHWMGPC